MRFARAFPLILVTGLLSACGDDSGSIGNGPSNVAPVAAFTAQCGLAPLQCDFVNTSTDTDGTIDIYAWDFGDNSVHASTQHTTHAYAAPGGLFTVTLSVTDDDGETATASRQVEVNEPNVTPTADFTVSCAHASCAFTDRSSDIGDSVASYGWDFGDGGTSTEANPVHEYGAIGTYTVTLTVTNEDGETGTASRQVEVKPNVPPTANFTVSCAGVSCAFTDRSADVNVVDSVASYGWDFGDGRTSTKANPVHEYAAAGTYTVTLTVTDNLAAAGSTSRQVTLPFQPNAFPLLYVRVTPHSGPSDDQYLLYEDGTFVLQYVGGGEYRGTYSWGKATIDFAFGADPRWQATGFIHGDSLLTVKYTVVMALIGFEDGVYRLAATEALALPARHGTNSKP